MKTAWFRSAAVRIAVAVCAVALLAACGPLSKDPVIVSFDGGGALSGSVSAIHAHAGDRVTLPESSYEWPNRHFVGWAGGPFSKREALEPGDTVVVDESITFTAVWSLEVTFNGNGAEAGEMEGLSAFEGDEIELPECAFTRKGYQFSHWTTNLDKGTGTKEYHPGDKYPVVFNVTFFANWTRSDGAGGSEVVVSEAGEEITGRLDAWEKGDLSCTLKVTNNAEATIMLDATFTSLGKAGEEKGRVTDDAQVLGTGESVILYAPEMYEASAIAYTVTTSEAPGWMLPISKRIKVEEVSVSDDRLVVRVTNTSDEHVSVASVMCEARDKDGSTYQINSFATGLLKPAESLEATFERRNMPAWTGLDWNIYVEGFAREP